MNWRISHPSRGISQTGANMWFSVHRISMSLPQEKKSLLSRPR
ncbi:hypothetical protein GCWU000246_00262 [Jonquetella anthropi E3_33 E1]|nr:hypothetical protein GCWU000246_00262 [Jonquetella anthropi E3_33 E1]